MKKHTFQTILGMVLMFIILLIAWFWWLPAWLNQKIQGSLSNQGYLVEQLTWDHIGWHSSKVKTLRLRAINHHTQWVITNLTVQYHPLALLNNHLAGVQLHASAVHGQWFQDTDASPITLNSPLAWFTLIPLGLIQIDELDIAQYSNQKLLHRWHGSIKVQQGEVYAQLSELKDPQFRNMMATLTVSQQGDMYASIRLNHAPLLLLQGMLNEDHDRLQLKATLTAQIKPMLHYFPVLLADHPMKGEGELSLQLKASIDKGLYQTPHDILQNLGIEFDWQIHGTLQQTAWHGDGHIKGHISLHHQQGIWRVTAPQLIAKGKDWSVKLGEHQLQGLFHLGKNDSYVTLGSSSFTQWDRLRWDNIIVDGAKFQNKAVLRGSWQGRTSPWETEITLPTLSWMKQQFSSKVIHLLLPAPTTNNALKAELSIQDFQWDNTFMHLPKGDVGITMQWHKKLQASLNYTPKNQRPWQFNMAWQPNIGKGNIDFNIAFNQPEKNLNDWFPATRTVFKKLSLPLGQVKLKGGISLDSGLWQGRGRLVLNHLQGHYIKNSFHDLHADLPFTFNSNGITLSQGMIDVLDIDVGIPLHHIKANLGLAHRIGHGTRLNIGHIQFNALGGQVWASNINLDTAKLDDKTGNPFTVRVKNINITELIALENQKKIHATGILDGIFPSNFRRSGLFVAAGKLTARPPGGIIEYTADAAMNTMMAQNMGAKLAFQVLNNFQYHQLDAKVDYNANGHLLLGLHVKGNNPAYDDGRPIEFNIQVQENLLDLFQSLTMANDISDKIEQRVDRGTRNNSHSKKENP